MDIWEAVKTGQFMFVKEAAEELGLSVQQVGNFCRAGTLPAEKNVRDHWVIDRGVFAHFREGYDQMKAGMPIPRPTNTADVAESARMAGRVALRQVQRDARLFANHPGEYASPYAPEPEVVAEAGGPVVDELTDRMLMEIIARGVGFISKTIPVITGDLMEIRRGMQPAAPELVAWDLQVVHRDGSGEGVAVGDPRRVYLTRGSVDQLVAGLIAVGLVDSGTLPDAGFPIRPREVDAPAWLVFYPAPPSR